MTLSPQCFDCRHFDWSSQVAICAAFPEGIPGEILTDEFDHRKPHPGDHGIRFEPAKEKHWPEPGEKEDVSQ